MAKIETRRYELKKRADRQQETRQRITDATLELHRTVGPAATQIAEIARRAGVGRLTVYNHFPDDAALFAACSAHWRSLHPTPDIASWALIDDRRARVRTALVGLYAWYRETEPMTANVLRDSELLPALRGIVEGGLLRWLAAVRAFLAANIEGPTDRVDAVVAVVTAFASWQAMKPLGDEAAADLAIRWGQSIERRGATAQ
jgi:AcrR family transcriptional regulator